MDNLMHGYLGRDTGNVHYRNAACKYEKQIHVAIEHRPHKLKLTSYSIPQPVSLCMGFISPNDRDSAGSAAQVLCTFYSCNRWTSLENNTTPFLRVV